ncbi:aldehyde dehydrogenase family protein [Actinotignum schaalii]|uniref:aldehyde dehydrogenase family protein n=1 Tax=Actinotignum schaalii TaxID=59505 RepID=UPI000425817D|nr:aldehyde dehydrogenase family protein [Actinotignum schaalii]AIE82491.1 succinate-semialdehyde dehydrogenase [Actinotignum schaalii]WQN44553.1 aldehyde dehydrogenase family protein [Actinotignum schaalii]
MTHYRVHNPNTGEVEERFPSLPAAAIPGVISASWEAFTSWRDTPMATRAALLHRFGELITERSAELADIIGREMGKPLRDGEAELAVVSQHAHWFADNAPRYLEPTQLDAGDGIPTYVLHQPLGVLLGIMPWNFPYSQIARFALPQLMVGNTILMKQAEICPRSSAAFEALLREAGLPDGAYQNIYLDIADTEKVLADPRVKGVSLTGSEQAGSSVAGLAGKYTKRSLLELGGNDAMVVLDAADIATVARAAVRTRVFNAGQVCTSNKRIIVLDSVFEEFLAAARAEIASIVVGPYDDPATDMGPLSSIAARDEVVRRVASAVAAGAHRHYGGYKIDRPGAFMTPALLTDIPTDHDIARNELFGPVVALYRAADEEAALGLANSTAYGLQSSVWSQDLEKAQRFAARLAAGMTIINKHRESAPTWPFGGINRSGYGREEGAWGLRAFTNEHAVRVHPAR